MGTCEDDKEYLGCIKGREYHGKLTVYYAIKMSDSQWGQLAREIISFFAVMFRLKF